MDLSIYIDWRGEDEEVKKDGWGGERRKARWNRRQVQDKGTQRHETMFRGEKSITLVFSLSMIHKYVQQQDILEKNG